MPRKATREEFIERARAVHGDKYGYSKVEYVKNSAKVILLCPEHGPFRITPGNHLSGRGCRLCGIAKRAAAKTKTTAQFVQEARKVHSDRYDYSKIDYRGQSAAVQIRCPEHGWFTQQPKTHLRGHGCFDCGLTAISKKKRKTPERFLEQAKAIHGDRYDYSQVEYEGVDKKVTIVCPLHGEFRQTPSVHVSNRAGCAACSGVPRYGLAGFLERARNAHGDLYDYSLVEYRTAKTKVEIVCPEHGSFMQEPQHHIKGVGCPDCGNDKIRRAQLKTIEEFVLDATAVHGGRYDYSQVNYEGSKNNVTIVCPEHGPFLQLPPAHLQGSGCPNCADSGIDLNAPGILYYLRVEVDGRTFWKIGITNRSVQDRYQGETEAITVLETWHFSELRKGYERERQILRNFSHLKYAGGDRLLKRGGNTELFVEDVLMLDMA